ncbi:MAG: nucleotidyltransferase domain-containing protein [Deltaproteobacteria bacterium]|nr:nucleotidyltransferase domain-containing protein [Deltaproteobacteria bacterium]
MICTLDELKKLIAPIAVKYGLPAVYLFGSYARGEAKEDSDVDILVDRTGTSLKGLNALCGLPLEFEDAVGKPVDLVYTSTLEQECTKKQSPWIIESIDKDKIKIYGQ